jgi:EAL domain-containing protein (putative c-di-GMP-specific phosphodiesterase class I)
MGLLGDSSSSRPSKGIPLYSSQVPLHLLQGHGSLSMLTINCTPFRKIAIEYGVETYTRVQEHFHTILESLWINAKKIRKTDIIMRRSAHSNTYYIFLEHSRITNSVPSPGVLEKIADRVASALQASLWAELFKNRVDRTFPECLNLIPEFSVGHATALYNPCVDAGEILEQLMESSTEASKIQLRRIRERAKEILQTIVQSRDVLAPHFQGVFNLQSLSEDKVKQVASSKSISPILNDIYGFESLIRVRKNEILNSNVDGDALVVIDNRHMRPDILFGLAAHSKVALELDQICLGLGVSHGANLPGKLMVNILPRNLLHLERLTHLISARKNIVFEISESERISNPEVMDRVNKYIRHIGCSIAADDFGKGHASIERVIKLRPELIKLDRSLVENIHKDPAKKIFAEGIVKAARMVNAKVLAEGVELWDEAQVFKDMGVDFIQGFLIHRPQSLEEIQKQLAPQSVAIQKLDSVA